MPKDENDVWVPNEEYSHNFDADPIDDGYTPPSEDNLINEALDADLDY